MNVKILSQLLGFRKNSLFIFMKFFQYGTIESHELFTYIYIELYGN